MNNSLFNSKLIYNLFKEEDEDISTPYSHYKCLSPKARTGKLLRRQFSLDRTEVVAKAVDVSFTN